MSRLARIDPYESFYDHTHFAAPLIMTLTVTDLIERYHHVRRFSQTIAEPLSAEDCAIQSMPDVSPTRWHLAHTTWFFETFLLKSIAGYEAFHPQFEMLFNSYYNSIGEQFPRARRGLISRPSLDETLDYRRYVDAAISEHFSASDLPADVRKVFEIGLQHEQQHQELMLTDIKHVLAQNPLRPVYRESNFHPKSGNQSQQTWQSFDSGVVESGHATESFCFDNELPRHSVFLHPYSICDQLVTNGQYLEFMQDGGYQRPELWLSAGWATCQEQQWQSPEYWKNEGDEWTCFTLSGQQPVHLDDPVCHVSYFEADAFARWAGRRLPTEFEWEHAVRSTECQSESETATWADQRIAQDQPVHPVRHGDGQAAPLHHAFGQVWEWTASQYTAYPGYRPPNGALGEYNGKFMCNQFVLRGGSCATPSNHIRLTYRNFFPPEARWQFTGIRLASDSSPK